MDHRSQRVNGDKIRELRKARSWTQGELAKRVGCNKRTIENAEAGKRLLLETISRLAEVFEVDPSCIQISDIVSTDIVPADQGSQSISPPPASKPTIPLPDPICYPVPPPQFGSRLWNRSFAPLLVCMVAISALTQSSNITKPPSISANNGNPSLTKELKISSVVFDPARSDFDVPDNVQKFLSEARKVQFETGVKVDRYAPNVAFCVSPPSDIVYLEFEKFGNSRDDIRWMNPVATKTADGDCWTVTQMAANMALILRYRGLRRGSSVPQQIMPSDGLDIRPRQGFIIRSGTAPEQFTPIAIQPPHLTVLATHDGIFKQGQTKAAYTVVISNASGAGATNAPVEVKEFLPAGLTLVSMSGDGWACDGATCTRADQLVAGAAFSKIIVIVRVAHDAAAILSNVVSVSGGSTTPSPGCAVAGCPNVIQDTTLIGSNSSSSVRPISSDRSGSATIFPVLQNTIAQEATQWLGNGTGEPVPLTPLANANIAGDSADHKIGTIAAEAEVPTAPVGSNTATRSNPSIQLTSIAPFGSSSLISGTVRNASPQNYEIVVLTFIEGLGWSSQPYCSAPDLSGFATINADGSWSTSIITGGTDTNTSQIAVYLVPSGGSAYTCTLAGPGLPENLESAAVARVLARRTDPNLPTIPFAVAAWCVKSNNAPFEPTNFSNQLNTTFIDGMGRLHLRVLPSGGAWQEAQSAAAGNATYSFTLGSDKTSLDPNTVVGMYTWSHDLADANREIDIELTRPGVSNDNDNARFVVQPFSVAGNLMRFGLNQSSPDAGYAQTCIFGGQTYQGFDLAPAPPASGIAYEFTHQAQSATPFGDGSGLVASVLSSEASPYLLDNCFITPFRCIPARAGLAATSWAVAADLGFNPMALTVTGIGPAASYQGSPSAQSTVALLPSALAFASQTVGASSAGQTVAITNPDTMDLPISFSVDGPNSGDFTLTNDCPPSLQPSTSCAVSITFTPAAVGSRTASLRLISATTRSQTVSLTGTGTGACATISTCTYQVLLSRIVATGSEIFYVYKDADSGLNHGIPSGVLTSGISGSIVVNAACFDSQISANDCAPYANATDNLLGTVFQITFPGFAGDQFAGLTIQDPISVEQGAPANGYDLTGATGIQFDVRSPQAAIVRFAINGCTTAYLRVPTTWVSLAIPWDHFTCVPDLRNLKQLFGVIANGQIGTSGATILFDNIRYSLSSPSPTPALGLPLTTQTVGVTLQPNYPIPSDCVNRSLATTYDTSLSILAMIARGQPQGLGSTLAFADALDYALKHDNQGEAIPPLNQASGLHSAYESGDLTFLSGQDHTIRADQAGNIRLAGFSTSDSLCKTTNVCLVLDGGTGGNNAWAILALNAAYLNSGDGRYLQDAEAIGNWIAGLEGASSAGYGGYFLGYSNKVDKATKFWKSTEHNIDLYVAFSLLAQVETSRGNTNAGAASRNLIGAERGIKANPSVLGRLTSQVGRDWVLRPGLRKPASPERAASGSHSMEGAPNSNSLCSEPCTWRYEPLRLKLLDTGGAHVVVTTGMKSADDPESPLRVTVLNDGGANVSVWSTTSSAQPFPVPTRGTPGPRRRLPFDSRTLVMNIAIVLTGAARVRTKRL